MQLCDHIWVNGTRVPDRYCGEANLMLLPVQMLSQCAPWILSWATSILFWKNLLGWELVNLWCIVSVAHWCCWLFNLQELCTVTSWFRHFAKRTMLLHYLPVKYLYNCTLWGSINLHNIHSASSFQQATVALSHKKVSSHGTCKLQRHTLCGSLLLFKTERFFRAIQHTCFCQLWVISTDY